MGDISGLSFDSLVVTIIVITTIIIAVRVSGKMSSSTKKIGIKRRSSAPLKPCLNIALKKLELISSTGDNIKHNNWKFPGRKLSLGTDSKQN